MTTHRVTQTLRTGTPHNLLRKRHMKCGETRRKWKRKIFNCQVTLNFSAISHLVKSIARSVNLV